MSSTFRKKLSNISVKQGQFIASSSALINNLNANRDTILGKYHIIRKLGLNVDNKTSYFYTCISFKSYK